VSRLEQREAAVQRAGARIVAKRDAWPAIARDIDAACAKVRRAVRLGKYDAALEAIRPMYDRERTDDWDSDWVDDFRRRVSQAVALAGTSESRFDSLAGLAGWFWTRTRSAEYNNERFGRPLEEMLTEPPHPERKRIEILVKAGELTEAIDRAEAALIEAHLGLYQMNGQIVRLGYVDVPGERERLRMFPVEPEHISELMGRVIAWSRFDIRKDEEVTTGCPAGLAKIYVARGPGEWKLPKLNAIITAPTLRPDASVVVWYGFDEKTGLYLDCDDECSPHAFGREGMGEDELADLAIDAVNILNELLVGFPFVAGVDLSVAMSAILTAVIRRNLPTAPLHAFTAPTPGSGKSYLVDLASIIATGKMSPAFSWSADDHENRKALDAALLAGDSAIAFDNVRIPLDGARLNQILTQTTAMVRVLGESRNVEVQCNAFVTANGNNLQIADDLTRRTLLCRLDSGLDRPELRQFESNPIDLVKADHSRYIGAALTILRCYRLAGSPQRPAALGSFTEWSDWVRGALIWLGYEDPVASMEHARDNDPVRTDIMAVMEQWNQAFGDRRMTTAEIIKAMPISANSELREAFLSVAGASGAVNTGKLGAWLRANKNRPVGSFKIESAGMVRGTGTWRLVGGRPSVATVDGVSLASLSD
jgi:hypothetical protein